MQNHIRIWSFAPSQQILPIPDAFHSTRDRVEVLIVSVGQLL